MDHIDEMIEFGLPAARHERKKMIAMYIKKHLLNPPGRWVAKVTTVDIGAIPDQDTFFKYMSQKDDWITTERANMLTTDC